MLTKKVRKSVNFPNGQLHLVNFLPLTPQGTGAWYIDFQTGYRE